MKYTWGKIWNAKAYSACSNMPRCNGDAEILTEAQIKDVMAYLFDPESPVKQTLISRSIARPALAAGHFFVSRMET